MPLLIPLSGPIAHAGGAAIRDDTGATINAPDGIDVEPNVGGVPEWHFASKPGAPSMPPLGWNKSSLCALQLSTSSVGGSTDPAYLKQEVEDQMTVVGAHDPPPAFEPSPYRFMMVTEWHPTLGDDKGNAIMLFHAESEKAYAYMSCVTKAGFEAAAKPLFRAIWTGVKLPN